MIGVFVVVTFFSGCCGGGGLWWELFVAIVLVSVVVTLVIADVFGMIVLKTVINFLKHRRRTNSCI